MIDYNDTIVTILSAQIFSFPPLCTVPKVSSEPVFPVCGPVILIGDHPCCCWCLRPRPASVALLYPKLKQLQPTGCNTSHHWARLSFHASL